MSIDELIIPQGKLKRAFFFTAGSISLLLGIVGIILPILPTTPFLLLATACFARSSERAYYWLLNNKFFGSYIRNYQAGKGIPIKIKIYAITLLWATILVSVFIFVKIFWIQLILLIIAAIVSIHIVLVRAKKSSTKASVSIYKAPAENFDF